MEDRISKSECARRLKVGPSMITKYIGSYSMPVNPDGSVSWAAVQAWHAATILPFLSGSYMHRRAQRIAPPTQVEPDPYTRGFVDGFHRARRNIRECLPEIFPELITPWEYSVEIFAVLDYLMENWLEADPDQDLPAIDWTKFTAGTPAEIQEFFADAREWLKTGKVPQ